MKDKKEPDQKEAPPAKIGDVVADPNKHDPGQMPGNEWTNGQSDAQRERRHEDIQTDVNKEIL